MAGKTPSPGDSHQNGTFELDPRLAADSIPLACWALCQVRLMNDANYPWLILVPERPGLRDLHDLAPDHLTAMMDEIVRASRALQAVFRPEKLNVAAIGNLVPQLHVHLVARFTTDPAWPKPVWGAISPRAYESNALDLRMKALLDSFAAC